MKAFILQIQFVAVWAGVLILGAAVLAVLWSRVLRLRKIEEARGRILSQVSRDIRTSLHAIIGFADILELDGKDDEARVNAVRAIRSAGQSLLKRVDGMANAADREDRETAAASENAAAASDAAVPAGETAAEGRSDAAKPLQLPRKVLLVDDSTVNRAVGKALLNKLGVPIVLFANDGREALKKLDETIEMVFTDLWMPNLDGAGLLREIRAQKRYAALPVYALTADVGARDNAANFGFTEMLLKPITIHKLRKLFC